MESIKDHIKALAKDHSKKMVDMADALGITSQGMYKSFREGTVKLNQLEQIAEFIGVYITELFPRKPPGDTLTIVGDSNTTYGTRVDKNNFFGGGEKDYVMLKSENEHLKETIQRQEKEIERQEKEILFLRELVKKS